jgi:hypothetical protein
MNLKNLSSWELEQEMFYRKMRKTLLNFLWDKVQKESPLPSLPFPMMDDDQVKSELKKILGFK